LLDIPGESLRGNYTARQFVGWYNGHQDHRHHHFDLSQEVVAIIGHGNVALDVARILAKPVDALRQTDIAEHALDVLAESRVKEIHIFGRRGPLESKFSARELSEFASLPGCCSVVDSIDLAPLAGETPRSLDNDTQRKLDLFRQFSLSKDEESTRRCHFHFHRVPVALVGGNELNAIRFEKSNPASASGTKVDFECGLLFQSVGCRGLPIDGLPFNEAAGVLRHQAGRLAERDGTPLHGMYATGWIKRGATGIIGTNRADSLETVETLFSDLPFIGTEKKSGASGIRSILAARGKTSVDYRRWLQIDRREVEAGRARGKPREKITSLAEFLAVAE
jgi:ferredoxin--NADP+ reductase